VAIAILGLVPNGTVDSAFNLSADFIFRKTGMNIGNLVFTYTVQKMFDEDIRLISHDADISTMSDVNALVIPAANFLYSGFDLEHLAKLVESANCPCLIFGLGAQSEIETKIPELKPGTVRFLKAVSEKTKTICVRGEYTAEVCRHYGVNNVEVLGCPSILMNENRALGDIIEKGMKNVDVSTVAVHAACAKRQLSSVEKELTNIVQLYQGSRYFIQRPLSLIKSCFNEPLDKQDMQELERTARILAPNKNVEWFDRFIKTYGEVPASTESWLQQCRSFSCAIGTRIHGTIVPLSAGVPSVCITHDTRTRELTDSLLVPSLTAEEFITKRYSPESLFKELEWSGKAFEDNRTRVASKYIEFIEAEGLKCSSHLLSFKK
jgi:hypothetical protein